MKKYYIIGALGLVLSLVAGVFVYKYNIGSDEGVLEYVPGDFGQMLYFANDRDFNAMLEKAKSNIELPQDVKKSLDMIKDVDQVVMFENNSGSLVLLKTKSGFNVNKAFESGFLRTGDNMIDKYITNDILAYGTKESIDYISNLGEDTILKNEKVKNYVQELVDGTYNFSILSKPDLTSESVNLADEKYRGYAESINYGIFLTKFKEDSIDGKVDVLLKKDLPISSKYTFAPQFKSILSENDYMNIEVGNVMQLLDIQPKQVKAMIQGMLSNQDFGLNITDSDLDGIVSSLDGNIGLSLGTAGNALGLGGALMFKGKQLFDVGGKYFVILKSFLPTQEGSGSIITFQDPDKYGATLALPYQGMDIKGDIFMEKKDDNSVFNIMNYSYEGVKSLEDYYNDKTIARIYVNFKKIIELYDKVSLFYGLPNNDDIKKGLWFLKDKSLKGYLSLNPNTITLNFKVK